MKEECAALPDGEFPFWTFAADLRRMLSRFVYEANDKSMNKRKHEQDRSLNISCFFIFKHQVVRIATNSIENQPNP